MPFITGTVSTFTNKFINTPETIGTGNGVATVFSYTVTKPPIFISGVKISYVIAAVTHTPTSDANGNFTGTGLTSGTVTEAGLISLTFSTAPDNASLIRVTEYTTKGIAQKLKEFICAGVQYTETVGTGNGVTLSFNYVPTAGPIAKGQIRLKFRISGVWYWVYDNGNAEFIHDKIVSSIIDYDATPSIDITFVNPPENTFSIEIVYTDSAIEGRDWLIWRNTLAKTNLNVDAFPGLLLQEYIFRNSGKNYSEDLCFGLRESQHIATNQYLLELNIYEQFNEAYFVANSWNYNSPQVSFDTTTKHWTAHPSSTFADLPMTYWIRATKNIVSINVKVAGTIYTGFLAGVGIRFSSKQNYPNPCFIIGNSTGNFQYTSIASTHSMYTNVVGTNQFWYIKQTGGIAAFSTGGIEGARIQPTTSYIASGNIGKTTNNKVVLYELFVENVVPTKLNFQIPDIYHTPFLAMTTEDELTEGVDIFKVFQNIFRTTSFDFYAVKMTD